MYIRNNVFYTNKLMGKIPSEKNTIKIKARSFDTFLNVPLDFFFDIFFYEHLSIYRYMHFYNIIYICDMFLYKPTVYSLHHKILFRESFFLFKKITKTKKKLIIDTCTIG